MGNLILCYHGCDRDVAENLLSGKSKFKVSQNEHDWLGHGIYFWEDNPKRAIQWAHFMAAHPTFKKRVRHPYAVGAIIDYGVKLDLTDSTSLGYVKGAYYGLKDLFELGDTALPSNKPTSDQDEDLVMRHLDCAVINYFHELRKKQNLEPFATVRGAFQEGGPLYPGSAFRQKTHIQVCVRDPKCIKGIFRIPEIDHLLKEAQAE